MDKRKYRYVVFLLIMICVFSIVVSADMTARSIGLGDEFVVLEGITGLFSNPASVDINDNSFALEFTMAGEAWNNVFVNDNISEADKEKLVKIAGSDGLLIAANANLGGKMGIGPLVLFTDGKANSLFRVSDDFAELLIRGNEIEGEYLLDGTDGALAFYLDSGINYSFKIDDKYLDSLRNSFKVKNMYLGITYHYLRGGFAKYEADGGFELGFDEEGDPFVSGNSGKVSAYYTDIDDFKSTAVGHGFDLGLYADYDDKYSWGFAVLNIGASLQADTFKEYEYGFEYDEDNDEWNTTEPVDDGVLKYQEITMDLPLVIKFGGKMKYSDNLDLFANYTMSSYSDSIYNDSLKDHRIALALEYTGVDFLPLRTGLNYSTLERDFDIAAGLGLYLGPLKIDVGISDLSGLFYRSKGVAGGISLRLEF